MRKSRLRLPSPAMVVACISLVVALGGTAYATVIQVPRASVGTVQLKTGAVTSVKVKDRSLRLVDFAAAERLKLRGPQGVQGPKGDKGEKGDKGDPGPQGPVGVSGLEIVSKTSLSSSFGKTAVAVCPSGKRVLGGGGTIGGNLADVGLSGSRPDLPTSWIATAREFIATNENWTVTAWAMCAAVAGG